jgi:hypothetical protein
MRTRPLLPLLLLGALGLGPVSSQARAPSPAEPGVFSSPLHAACVRVEPSTCKLHVDPFIIPIAPGQQLLAFQLRANGSLLYDYRTDVSNPPSGSFSPSLVRLDFAATCGVTYTVNLLARDTADAALLNAGQAEGIACPLGDYDTFMPAVGR